MKIAMLIAILNIVIMAASAYAWPASADFGAAPTGLRLQEVKRSEHYPHGDFLNLVETQIDTGNSRFFSNFLSFFLDRNLRQKLVTSQTSMHTDLKSVPLQQDVVIWLGYSSATFS